MILRGRVRKSEYADSVAMMLVAKAARQLDGILDAAVLTGSAENKAILKASGLNLSELDGATDGDIMVALKGSSEAAVEKGFEEVQKLLKNSRKVSASGSSGQRESSLEGAVKLLPSANLALISIAGRHAAEEAHKALDAGLHVMLFSDNVPLADEILLKNKSVAKDLLVMGPDCGTAILNGVPLGFANVVRRGSIGVVAASGTGLQEVTCLISNRGGGISQAIGTGGRDIKKEVGGKTFLQAIGALQQDPATKTILLVAKPPHAEVMKRVIEATASSSKPVVALFMGDTPATRANAPHLRFTDTLEEAALMAVELSRNPTTTLKPSELSTPKAVLPARLPARAKGGFARGLFSGGTFAAEAQLMFSRAGLRGFSNAPAGNFQKLERSLESVEHTFVDFGEDEFTVGRPHPMIDFSLRCQRLVAESADPAVGLILLDLVLGHGSHLRPMEDLAAPLKTAASRVPVGIFITGTPEDPQGLAEIRARLESFDCAVFETCASACRWAIQHLKGGA